MNVADHRLLGHRTIVCSARPECADGGNARANHGTMPALESRTLPEGAPGRAKHGATAAAAVRNAGSVTERNVLGGHLEPCGTDPLTGFFRDGCCSTGPEDVGSHTICAVVTAEFLEHQRSIGNDLSTPRPQYGFPGLAPGDRW